MTLLKRGSALLAALVLIFQLATYPARASSAVALTAVGGATVIAAYMAACGIYPYTQDGQSFGEWGASALTDLVEQYNQYKTEQEVQIAQFTGYVVGRTIAISRGVWDKLRDFVSWITDEFHLENNQAGYNIGSLIGGAYLVPYSTAFSAASPPTRYQVTDLGIGVPYNTNGRTNHVLSSCPGVIMGGVDSGSAVWYYIAAPKTSDFYWSVTREDTARLDNSSVDRRTFNGDHLRDFDDNFPEAGTRFSNVDFGIFGISYSNISPFVSAIPWATDVPIFSSNAEFWEYCKAYFGGTLEATLSGITADTVTISVPAELSEDTEWVGLSVYPGETGVADTPASTMTPEKVQQVIQQGVEARQKPDVRPADIVLSPGTTIDTETGVVSTVTVTDTGATTDTGETVDTGSTMDTGATAAEQVVVDPAQLAEEYVPAVSELVMPGSVADTFLNALQTKFPFSIPFDLMKILQAFVVPPSAPVITLSFHDPFSGGDFSISTDLSPWDEVAAVVRQLETIFMLVGFSLNIPKIFRFNNVMSSDFF